MTLMIKIDAGLGKDINEYIEMYNSKMDHQININDFVDIALRQKISEWQEMEEMLNEMARREQ